MLKKIMELVQAQGHCVLATCSEDRPHASLMSFCPSPDGREFWLATLTGTRKYANLCANPRACLLLDDRVDDQKDDRAGGGVESGAGAPGHALTVDAELLAFAGAQDEARARRALLARHPGLAGFLALDGVRMLRFVGRSYQLLSGPTDVFLWTPADIS